MAPFVNEIDIYKATQPVELDTIFIEIDESIIHFSQIPEVAVIPTNRIIDKTLPGLGATYSEIKANRNSILVLPNVATILSKHNKHKDEDNTFPVYEGITKKQLAADLAAEPGYKKILTTPEGFEKVKEVLGDRMYDDYFILLDECHKIILDSHYRQKIILPMDDFFRFKGKAMVSSTTIATSDRRFVKHRFKGIILKPTWQHRKPLKVIGTSDALIQLMIELQANPSNNYCIFFNSIDGITSAIDQLKKYLGDQVMEDDFTIYCSRESAISLRLKGYNNAHFEYAGYKKYNFFTSSFYNGLDIEFEGEDVDVIMVSDVRFANYTAIDPFTDATQIRGRFRPYKDKDGKRVDWVRSFKHIVHTDKKIPYLNADEARLRIKDSQALYEAIRTFKLSSPGSVGLIKQMLERVMPYVQLIDKSGELNPYKVDNYIYKEKIIGYYRSLDQLQKSYELAGRFNLEFDTKNFKLSGLDKLKHSQGKYSPENYRDITDTLWELEGEAGSFENRLAVTQLFERYELIVRAYFDLGIELLLELQFDHKLIMKTLDYCHFLIGSNQQPVIDAVHQEFKVNARYTKVVVKDRLQNIFDLYKVNYRVTAEDIRRYFEVDECQKQRHRAFYIQRPLHASHYSRV